MGKASHRNLVVCGLSSDAIAGGDGDGVIG
jgi:hypothetical protein